MRSIRTILVPTDFSPPSERALAFAIDLAGSVGAGVHVASAFELPIMTMPDGVFLKTAGVAASLLHHTQKSLERACEPYRGRAVALAHHIEQGDPREVIIEVAHRLGADLIVMGTHGRRGIARAIFGSVADAVLRSADVPVVTLR